MIKPCDEQLLPEIDASNFIGLNVSVRSAAILDVDQDYGESLAIPGLDQLSASAAVARCLASARLRGDEVRAIRKICGWTAGDLGSKMDEGKCSSETVICWEDDKQPMSAYAEKVFRLCVCEELAERAPGIVYKARMIADLKIDSWLVSANTPPPRLEFERIKVRMADKMIEAWWLSDRLAA